MNAKSSFVDVCAAPVTMCEDGQEFVCVRLTDGLPVRITFRESRALVQANEMKPFAEHVAALCELEIGQFVERLGRMLHITSLSSSRISLTLKEWRRQGLISGYGGLHRTVACDFSGLRAKGLLLTERELLATLAADDSGQEADVDIRFLCVPTLNRPKRLSRCLNSFRDNFEKNERYDTTIFVVQDSEDASNKEIIAQARTSSRVHMEHFGLQDRNALVDALVKRTSVPREIVEFALSQPKVLKTAMPARNAFTLMTLGDYVFHTDDDTCCAHAALDCAPDTVFLTADNKPCEMWFYPDQETILRERHLDWDFDILSSHEELLGKTIARAVRRSVKVGWRQMRPELLSSIYSGSGYIGMTSTGCLGESGLYASGAYLISSTDETLARMCASPKSYKAAIYSGMIVNAPTSKVISRGTYFQGMSYAVDNTRLQPPYFPMGRNADGASALLYLLSDTHSWIAHLPWAVFHESDVGRDPYFVEHTQQFSRVRLCDVLMYTLWSAAVPAAPKRDQALVAMGEQLVALAELPASAFTAFLRGEFTRRQLATVKLLEEKIATFGRRFPLWEQDARILLSNIKKSITEVDSIVPVDVEVEVGRSSALEFTQNSIRCYGRLLCSWQELVAESRVMIQQAA